MLLRRALGLLPALFLVACSSISSVPRTVSLSLKGNVHGGQQPVTGASIELYAVGLSGGGSSSTPLLTTPVITDGGGSFSITGDYSCPTAFAQVYVVARGGNPGLAAGTNNSAITLAAPVGACGNLSSSSFLNVNEVTTVALASSLAAFSSEADAIGSTPSDAVLLDAAFDEANRLASTSTGTSPGANLPSGVTVPSTRVNTLANVLASCVNSRGGVAGDSSPCGRLFSLTTAPGSTAPSDTFSAAMRIADAPSLNIAALFDTVSPVSPFQPQLPSAPPTFYIHDQTAGALQLSTPFLAFGAVSVDSAASGQDITLTNSGGQAVAISSVALTGADPGDFTLQNGCPASLAASASCTLHVTFQPVSGGRRVAAVAIENSSPAPTLLVELSGIGSVAPPVAPTLTSLSPAFVPIGASSAVVTLSGAGFTPYMEVLVNGYTYEAQYISPQSATISLSGYQFAHAGTISIGAFTWAGYSNTLNLPVQNPTPVLSSISPVTVLANAPDFPLTLTGSNFTSESAVLINGVSHTVEFGGSATSISTFVKSSDLVTPGNLDVVVTNPSPGGGSSLAQTLKVVSTPNRYRTINAPAADIVSDPAGELLYAAVFASTDTGSSNSVIAIDPVLGSVVATAPLTATPSRLAISDDGSLLYAATTDGAITRFKLPSLAQDITFTLPSGLAAGDIAVAPGHPHTLAASVAGTDAGMRTVRVYDDAVPRPLQPSTRYSAVSFDTLAWGQDASTLFATSAVGSGGPEFVLSVDGNGPTLVNTLQSALGDFDRRLLYDPSTRHLYDGYGNVVDPATGTRVGLLEVENTIGYVANDLVVDAAAHRAFVLNSHYFSDSDQTTRADIQSFDLTNFTHVSTLNLPNLSGSRIVRWGSSGLAVAGSDQIFLIDGAFTSGSGPSVQAGAYAGTTPTITALSPQSVAAGSSSVDVLITGRDLSPAAVATWNNHMLPVSWQSATQVTVTMPASYLASAASGSLTLTNGPGTESSNQIAFVVLPDLGPNLHVHTLPVSGQEMAWDPTRSLLYVAVSDPGAPNGDTIAAVDPATATIKSTLATGYSPYTLDTSDDGKYLYVGFSRLQAVNRYKLDDLSLDLTIPLTQGLTDQNFAGSVRVAPGSNQTFAVSAGSPLAEPRDIGGVTIFDGSTPRPNRSSADMYQLTWGGDATQLIGNSDPILTPQNISVCAVSSAGLCSQTTGVGFAYMGLRPHYDPYTRLVYTDGGFVFDPNTARAAGTLLSDGWVVPDGASNRAYLLHQVFTGTGGYALDVFDLRRQTLLRSIPLFNMPGYPTQILRWGSYGLAILTQGPGLLYLLQGSDITGQTAPLPGSVTLSPTNLAVNSGTGTTVHVTGANFQPGSVVLVNGVQRATTFVSSSQVTFQVTAEDQAIARDLSISVSNLVGGGTSPDSTLEIDNPQPTVASLSSSLLPVNGPDTTITVTGTGFVPTSIVRLNGNPRTSTYLSPTTLSVVISSFDLTKIATLQLAVVNAGPGGGSSAATPVQVGNAVPSLNSLSSASVTVGSGAQTLQVFGSGFAANSVVNVNGHPVTTTFVYSTQLSFSLPASSFTAAGSLTISVTTPAPGGGTSGQLTLTISDGSPTGIQLTPSTVIQGASTPATITVTGSGFIPSSLVLVSGQSRTTTYISPTRLTFRLAAADQSTTGSKVVTVVNPVPGGDSRSASLIVLASTATPVITSVSPTQYVTNSGSSYLQVTGTGITSFTSVLWNGNSIGGSASPDLTYVLVSVPEALLTSVGTATITLSSPSATPSVSNAVSVVIADPSAPMLKAISPNIGPLNTEVTLTVTGSQFANDSVVSINGNAVKTTFQDTSTLTADVPPDQVRFGNNVITVGTPQPGGGTSSSLVYTAYLPQVSNSMLSNAANGLLYMSVPGSAGAPYGNSIVPLDPVTGALGTPIFVGSEPNHMALTSDGRYLWVGLDGANAVRRIDLSTGTAGSQFTLFSSPNFSAKADAIAAVPGQPDSVVVSFGGSVALFDSGVPRKNSVAIASNALQVDSTRAEVYSIAGQSYDVLTYDTNGLTKKLATTSQTYLDPGVDSRIQVANGRAYSDKGPVVDSESGVTLGDLSPSPNSAVSTAVDVAQGLAFSLNSTAYSPIPDRIQVFQLADLSPARTDSIPVNMAINPYTGSAFASGLTRWGANGLAFRTASAIFALRSNLVKDLSSTPADLAATVSAAGAGSTGAVTTYTAQVTNKGPSDASEVFLSATTPATGTLASVNSTSGSCSLSGPTGCRLGTLRNGETATITFVVNQLTAGTSTLTVEASASAADPDLSNNRASVSTTVTGNPFNPAPAAVSLTPSTILAGSADTTITISGTGFVSGSIVQLDGAALPTSVLSGTQLSATVPSSSLATLGWHAVTVTTPAPGGGLSHPLVLSVYSALKAGLSGLTYDPYTRSLIGSLPSNTPAGNSVEFIHPETGAIDTPIPIGSEPTRMALSDDGQMLYVLLTASNSLQRFNMLTQQPEFSLSVPPPFGNQTSPYLMFSVQPGSEDTLALSVGSFYQGQIADFNPATQTASVRSANTGYNFAAYPQFLDGTHLLVNNSSRLDEYTIDSQGFSALNPSLSSYLNLGGPFQVVGKRLFSAEGNIADVSTIPGSLLGSFPVSFNYTDPAFAVEPASSRTFFLANFDGGSKYQSYDPNGIAAFDNSTFLPATFLPMDIANVDLSTGTPVAIDVVRWGQDGLAALSSGGTLYLIRGPAVLPQLLQANAAPTLATPAALVHGPKNASLAISGTNFQPGLAAAWNGSYRTTTFVDATHATILLPASDLATPGSATLTLSNPGSQASNPVNVTIN